MEGKCSAFMCSKTVEDGVKLFQFPENYTHNWIFAVDRGPTWTPDINSRLCSDHFHQDAFFESDKLKAMKVGSEPYPGAVTSFTEEEKFILVSKIRAENLRQEELKAKSMMNEVMSKENPELWEVVVMLKETEVEIQEFATEVNNRFVELDPSCDKKVVVEKIIHDIKTTQNKVEGYIMKERNNKETDFGFKLPKLEPGIEGEVPQEDHKRGIHDAIHKMKKEDHVESKEKPNFEIDASLYCESVLDMAVALDEAKFLKEIGSGLNSLDYVNEEENINDYDNDFEEVSFKKEVKPRIIKPKTTKPRSRPKTGKSKRRPCCKLCVNQEMLPSPIELRKHVLQVHGEPPYQCIKCEHKLETYVKYAAHYKNVHNQKIVECTECHKEMKQGKMRQHMMMHTGERPHSCDVCGKSFTLKTFLNVHMRVHSDERPYSCEECGKTFKQTAHLSTHIDIMHKGNKMKYYAKLKVMCGTCGKVLKSKMALKIHERSHTGERPFKCDQCEKAFSQISALAHHKDMHNTGKFYSCEQCGKSMKFKQSLLNHMKTHEPGYKNETFVCEPCNITYKAKFNLRRHIRVFHEGIKPYICEVCKQAFSNTNILKQHMRVHTGEKPYHCEGCNKSFSQDSSLYSHRKHCK